MFREALGLEPQEVGDNLYIPGKTIMKLLSDTSDYKATDYPDPYTGDRKVLVLCTESDRLKTKNGKDFQTGNQPQEMFVPLLHLQAAGFDFDIATTTGKPVTFEDWAFPSKDENVKRIKSELQGRLDAPLKMADVAANFGDQYIAVFIPGGHGALIGLPSNEHVQTILDRALRSDLTIISLCHGPAALLACSINVAPESFPFKGYSIVCNPDGMDTELTRLGYLPGRVKPGFSKRLEKLGVEVKNVLVRGNTHVDRNLITGDGPPAADKLGQLAANALLEAAKQPQAAK